MDFNPLDATLDDGGVDDLAKGPWTPEEDNVLRALVLNGGARNWSKVAECIPGRSGKSCRLRWINQLNPAVRGGPFTPDEDAVIMWAQLQYGNKWASIAKHLPGRTDNHIKNRWNCTLKKRYSQLVRHLPVGMNPGALSVADIAALMSQHMGTAASRGIGKGPRGPGGPPAGLPGFPGLGPGGSGAGLLGPAPLLLPGGLPPRMPLLGGPLLGALGGGVPDLPLALREMGGGFALGGLGAAAGVLAPDLQPPLALLLSAAGAASLSPRNGAATGASDQERQEQGAGAGGPGAGGPDGAGGQEEPARGVKRPREPEGDSLVEVAEDSAAGVLRRLAAQCGRELRQPGATPEGGAEEDEDDGDGGDGEEDDGDGEDGEDEATPAPGQPGQHAAPPPAGDDGGGARGGAQELGTSDRAAPAHAEGGPPPAGHDTGANANAKPLPTPPGAPGAPGGQAPPCGYGSLLLGVPETLMQLSGAMRVVLSSGNLPAAQALVSKLEELAYSVLMQRAAYNLANGGPPPGHQQQQQQQQAGPLGALAGGGVDPQALSQLLLLTQGGLV